MWSEISEHARWVIPLLLVAAIAVAHRQIWRCIVAPAGRMTSWFVHFKDAWPILEEIADEFKPNHGSTLRDVVDSLSADHDADHEILVEQSIMLDNIQQQLERICTRD